MPEDSQCTDEIAITQSTLLHIRNGDVPFNKLLSIPKRLQVIVQIEVLREIRIFISTLPDSLQQLFKLMYL